MRSDAFINTPRFWASLWVLVTVTSAAADIEADRAAIDQQLRDGRFDQAALFCREQITNSGGRVADQATYTAELVRVLTEQARLAPLAAAGAIWDEALEAGDRFVRQQPRHPHTLLVTFQAAAAATVRVETEARTVAVTPGSRQEVLSGIRKAIRRWEGISADVESRLRASGNGRGAPQMALTVNTMRSVRDRVRHFVARALLWRAVMYQPKSDDRLLACGQAIEQLEKMAPNNVGDSWWDTRIDFVRALRLRGDLGAAAAEADRLLKGPQLSRCISQGLQAELLRVAVDARDWNQVARRLVDRPMANSEDVTQECPEWAQAQLEALLVLASAGVSSTDQGTADWNQKARAQMAAIGARHGLYWQRVAEATVARALPEWGSRDAGLLSDLATARLRQGDMKGAIKALEEAAEASLAKGARQDAWRMRFESAELCFQLNDFRKSLIRFGELAHSADAPVDEDGRNLGAKAQLMAIKASAQSLRHGTSPLETYRSHLRQFLSRWPDSVDADQVRFWLARLYQAEGECGLALDQYVGISREFDDAMAVVEPIGACCRSLHLRESTTDNERLAIHAGLSWLKQAAQVDQRVGPQPPPNPALITAATRIWLTRLQMLGASSGEWTQRMEVDGVAAMSELRNAAEGIQWVARVSRGEFAEAQRALAAFTSSDADLWDDLIRVLGRLSATKASHELAQLTINAIARARAQVAECSPSCEVRWGLSEGKAMLQLGQTQTAAKTLATLRDTHPSNADVQELQAMALSAGNAVDKEQALAIWRQLVRQAPKGRARWYRAKYQLAKTHHELGNDSAAAKIVALTRALYPDLGGSELRAKFDQLEAELSSD